MEQTSPLVISISRQLGSGGAYIGQQLAKNLNLFFADREIINEAAKKLSVLEEDVESQEEKFSVWESFLQSFASAPDVYLPPKYNAPTESELFKTESEIIMHLAEQRSSVIVGRCGFFILRNHPNHVSIFLHGNIDFRIKRFMEFSKTTEEIARKTICQTDKARALYVHTFTKLDWADAKHYDLTIDTSKIGCDNAIELIMEYLELKKVIPF